tara:strand:- start:8504 stop:9481 length:978 start_codon:yes stop_codon:yes gene_type:complete
MTKAEIISNIHTLVSHNVIGEKQLMSRYKGFRGEFSFENYIRTKYKKYVLLDGGIIFSIDNSESSLNNSVYLTATNSQSGLEDYKNIYKRLSNIGFKKMFFVLYNQENWKDFTVMHYPDKDVNLPIPDFKIFEYDGVGNTFEATNNQISIFSDLFFDFPIRKKNSFPITEQSKLFLIEALREYELEDIIKMYVNRLFLDGFVGFGKNKGKISDIDLILKRPDGAYRLIEIKEKDLARKIVGFGLDVPRLDDMNRIRQESGLDYFLVVRHIADQSERKLIGWKMISIKEFDNQVCGQKPTEGGTGMRSLNSVNPTVICEVEAFTII